MTIRQKTPEIFKQILRVETGLEHEVRDHKLQQEEDILKYISAAE